MFFRACSIREMETWPHNDPIMRKVSVRINMGARCMEHGAWRQAQRPWRSRKNPKKVYYTKLHLKGP